MCATVTLQFFLNDCVWCSLLHFQVPVTGTGHWGPPFIGGTQFVSQSQANIRLQPLPSARDPFPEPLLNNQPQSRKQRKVSETQRATESTTWKSCSQPSQFFVKQVLSDGWAGRHVSLLALKGGGGGAEDAQALKGSQRAGRDVKIKTCKFLSCPPALAIPPASHTRVRSIHPPTHTHTQHDLYKGASFVVCSRKPNIADRVDSTVER